SKRSLLSPNELENFAAARGPVEHQSRNFIKRASAGLTGEPDRVVREPEVPSDALGVQVELLGRVLVSALVIALPLRLLAHLLDEGRGGFDLDEVEDPFHR